MKTINEYQFKSVLVGIGITLLTTSLTACDWGADTDNANNAGASPGYDAGYEFGIKLALLRQQQQPGIELDEALNGLRDALSDTNQYLSSTEMCAMLQPAETRPDEAEFKPAESVLPQQTPARERSNIVDFTTDDYAELNASHGGVVTLPSGVQYVVLTEGSGEQSQAGDTLQIRYQAFLDNGTIIDATDVDGGPLHMPLDDIVAPGLKEVLLLMNAGSRWQVILPPSKDFNKPGSRMFHGRERRMIRRRDLIYDLELISIDKEQPTNASN